MTPAAPKLATRRAVLLGATAPDLRGVEADLELMHGLLRQHGFAARDITRVSPATRDAITDSLAALVEQTRAGDLALIYYSGHGACFERRAGARSPGWGEAHQLRFLVPSDFADSTPEDFRGYTNVELSLVLAALGRRCQNVVAILDCCFAGRMTRTRRGQASAEAPRGGPRLRGRTLGPKLARAARVHLGRLEQTHGSELAARCAEANTNTVCVLASGAGGRAYELEDPPGGVMTHELHQLLSRREVGHLTWRDLGRSLRSAPRRHGVEQELGVEGPHRRYLFSVDERREQGLVEVEVVHGSPELVGGELVGAGPGDRYELLRLAGAGGPEVIAQATVVSPVQGGRARLRLHRPRKIPADGAWARPRRWAQARAAVDTSGPRRPERELLRSRLQASGLLHVGAPEPPGLPVVARVVVEDARVRCEVDGVTFDRPRHFDLSRDPAGAHALADELTDACHKLARAACLRRLPGGTLERDVSLSWARVRDGRMSDSLRPGEVVGARDRVTLIFDCDRRRYLSAFAVGADGRIELLTRAQGSGVEVGPGARGYLLGERSQGELTGLGLRRPKVDRFPADAPLSVTLVAVVSDAPLDLRSWEQQGLAPLRPRDPLAPPRRSRNFPAPSARPASALRYFVDRLDLRLAPGKKIHEDPE